MNFSSKITLLINADRLILLAFLSSGLLLICLYSSLMSEVGLSISIIIFFNFLPWMLLWPTYGLDVIKSYPYRVEVILIIIILLLGILNVLFSDNIDFSFQSMRFFLLSGILSFWTSIFIFGDPQNRKLFYYFTWVCLVVITVIELRSYLGGGNKIFLFHAIPLGTLVILLSVGPLNYLSAKPLLKNIAIVSILLGLMLVIFLQKRGTILAIVVMAITWAFCHYRKLWHHIIGIILIIILITIGWMKYKSLDSNIPSQISILHRIELYSFAWEVYKQKPILGIGVRPFTHGRYLLGYRLKNKNLTIFSQVINQLQTFDNMLLTGLVEFGSLMTLTYLILIFYVIIRYCRRKKPFAAQHQAALIPLLPIIGLAVHSMTYDSLIFSQINWLFHAQLGILAARTAAVGESKTNNISVSNLRS